jgi:hypothetical protein
MLKYWYSSWDAKATSYVLFLPPANDAEKSILQEWKRELPKFLAAPAHPPGPSFYANVFHPEFNLDLDGATDTVNRFERHVGAVGKSVHALRNVFTKVRENGIGQLLYLVSRFPCE